MQSNKPPGLDGLPKEFYDIFWDQLKDPMLQVSKRVSLEVYFPHH